MARTRAGRSRRRTTARRRSCSGCSRCSHPSRGPEPLPAGLAPPPVGAHGRDRFPPALRPEGNEKVMEESPFKGQTGLRRVWNAIGYSVHGFMSAFRHEEAFRQEVLLAMVLIPVALVLDVGGAGKALMVGSVLLVLIVELLNSAVEAAVDRISLDRHNLAKRAKDIGSAAVFLSLINVAAVWALVLFSRR